MALKHQILKVLLKIDDFWDPLWADVGENDQHVGFWFKIGTWRATLIASLITACITLVVQLLLGL